MSETAVGFSQRNYSITNSEKLRIFAFRNQLVDPDNAEGMKAYEFLRVVRVLSGSCVWLIEGREYDIRPGNIVILNNTERRAQIHISRDEPFTQEVIEFLPMAVYPCVGCLNIFFSRRPDFHSVADERSPHYADALRVFGKISEETERGEPWCDEVILGSLISLLAELSRTYGGEPSPRGARTLQNFEIVCESVKHINRSITLGMPSVSGLPSVSLDVKSLADRAGFSQAHFSRVFSEVWGIGPAEYVRLCRVRAALELINTRKMNVIDAAFECGFASSSGFYKAVREVTGETPRAAASDRRM